MKFTNEVFVLVHPSFKQKVDDPFWVRYTPNCPFFKNVVISYNDTRCIGAWATFYYGSPQRIVRMTEGNPKFELVKTDRKILLNGKEYSLVYRK